MKNLHPQVRDAIKAFINKAADEILDEIEKKCLGEKPGQFISVNSSFGNDILDLEMKLSVPWIPKDMSLGDEDDDE